eukprot:CAMPEP_0175103760 /NCGR_PEP_ID=MMETSP0086_2-20121207/9283_1 /TAXON_ID=136419 /ORGANISM="Unknown Unknown, Strain D1" /LENGTH=522 /DNA_ID=CAMNT_0016378941 /DNA_START=114 /DNA_END=1682 /DNA_ORIENTATION=-
MPPTTTETNKHSKNGKMKLKKQPPPFPFLRHPFEVEVALEDSHLNANINYSKLKVFLVSAGQPVEGARIVRHSTKAGVCKLTVEITNPNLAHSRDSAQLRVTYEHESILSNPFDVILAKVEITENRTTESLRFFKDKGGKNNYISVKARVFDKHNRAPNTKIVWACTLMYDNFKVVDDQNILKYHFEDEKDNGEFVLKYRIEQVSRAHCSRDFLVRLHADNDPTVSFDTTQSVTVLSKINHRTNKRGNIVGSPAPKKTRKPKALPALKEETLPSVPSEQIELSATDYEQVKSVRNLKNSVLSEATEYVNLLKSMKNTLKQLEWQHCGFATSAMTGQVDMNRKIYRCPICYQYKTDPDHLTANSRADHTGFHAQSCTILQNLQQFDCLFGGSAVVVPEPMPSPSFTPTPPSAFPEVFNLRSQPGTSIGVSGNGSLSLNFGFFPPELGNCKKRKAEDDLDTSDVDSPHKLQRLGSFRGSLHVELDPAVDIPTKIMSMNSLNSVDFPSDQAPVDETNTNLYGNEV